MERPRGPCDGASERGLGLEVGKTGLVDVGIGGEESLRAFEILLDLGHELRALRTEA
jgi:hypothetical protein